jgi:hypothetical protein
MSMYRDSARCAIDQSSDRRLIMVYWTANNLERHYQKHPAGKDKKCWMDLLDTTTPVTKPEYKAESIKVTRTSWIEYRAAEADPASYSDAYRNPGNPAYHPPARYYTDARLVRTVVNISDDEIRTCYHEHFDGKHEIGSGSLHSAVKNVDAMVRYINRLRNRRNGAQIINLIVEAMDPNLPRQIRLMIDELRG